MFLEGKDREIQYISPDNVQPDYPYLYLTWGVLIAGWGENSIKMKMSQMTRKNGTGIITFFWKK
jgi:hypothetical protein